jgi:hypothetical protein
MKNICTIAIFLSFLMLSACGTYNQSVQVDDRAYLLLIGSPDDTIVSIDNREPINLSQETTSYNLNGRRATKIEITTGKHSVKIIKNGNITVHRTFFVSNGNSFEVQL